MKLEEIFDNKGSMDKAKETPGNDIFYKGRHYSFQEFKSEINKQKKDLMSKNVSVVNKAKEEIRKMEDVYNNSDFVKKLKNKKVI